ncbi:hypothetical protein A3C98_04985 [Candidatus Roizmanbacteria bacterium RIFCSPHIGHO2_02_FULL_37_15]|nr:MAG: hypothetical protein A3C98_04985 [Candidatus Roizmanbacteria bacterium RIFCSPHIGHO2_02_FULL_37_15]OGK32109.1 MAG: hypothetical protein A3F57_03495 [Candidatus Roizmanbacteria bacterium RIFCSPHIGHO2_12_FULL_36_11]
MEPPQHWLHHKVFVIVFFLLIANLIALDLWVGSNLLRLNKELNKTKLASIPTSQTTSQSCPKNCLTALDDKISQLNLATKEASTQQENRVQDFYVPLGSGTVSSDEWTDVPGIKATVDTAKYGRIKKVVFEATTHVPNANEFLYVRLYNESDNHPVWDSELYFPSGTIQYFLVSPAIKLDPGINIYKVQMKTQLKFPANLDQARIHITTF